MGILRSDRITGLGGANAISGSVYFTGGTTGPIITIPHSQDFAFDTSDFTIEFWIKKQNGSNRVPVFAQQAPNGTDDYGCWIELNADNTIEFQDQESGAFASTGTIKEDTWTHVAMVRDSNTLRWFIDGVASGTSSYSGTMKDSKYSLVIGRWGESHYDNYYYAGYISNLRIQKGVAQYTSAFTPPTNRLEKTSETVLLCCQSSSDVTREETGKILVASAPANGAFPQATHHTPNSPVGFSTTTDVGSQYGTTFDGFGSFATSTYMVPPGGNSRERNRGRAVFGGGESPSADNVMEYINIQSGGRTIDFGDHTSTTPSGDAVSSSTRGVFANDYSPSSRNTLEFITIATTGNSVDFGDQNVAIQQEGAASNSTRGLFAGGAFSNQAFDVTEYITIATLGNGTDFGNLIATVTSNTGVADATRALFAGGIGPASPFPTVNRIEYFTIANTGNATDFGDLTFSARYPGSTGDSTRGVFMGGSTPSAINTICFVTIQTTGDATDFGDLVTASYDIAATSNNTRGIMGAGVAAAITNTIEQLTIQTTGNATDFGDLSRKVNQIGVCSDSHGGL